MSIPSLYATEDEVAALEARLDHVDGAERLDCIVALAWYLRQRDSVQALRLSDQAQGALSAIGQGDARQRHLARLGLVRAEVAALRGRPEEAADLLVAATAIYRTLDDAVGLGDASLVEVVVSQAMGRMDRVGAACETATAQFTRSGDTLRGLLARAWSAFFLFFSDMPAARLRLAALTEEIPARRHPALDAIVSALDGGLHQVAGEMSKAAASHVRAGERAREAGLIRHAAISSMNAADLLQTLGDYEDAAELIEAALTLVRSADWPIMVGLCLGALGELLRQLGQLERSHEVLSDAIGRLSTVAAGSNKGNAYKSLGNTLLSLKKSGEALSAYRSAGEYFRTSKHISGMVEALVGEARALSLGDCPVEAIERIKTAQGLARKHGVKTDPTDIPRALAEIHGRNGLPRPVDATEPTAELHFLEQALSAGSITEGWSAPVDLLLRLSEAWEAAGNNRRALDYLHKAIAAQEKASTRHAAGRALGIQVRAEAEKARLEAEHQRKLAAAEAQRVEILEGIVRERTAEIERRTAELAIARALQLALIPPRVQETGADQTLSIEFALEPAREIGGDLVDHFTIGDSLHVLVLGDVSQKGAGAALVMARTHSLLRGVAGRPDAPGLFKAPAQVAALVNRALARNNDGCMFVTLLLAVFDSAAGTLDYVSAGHVPPYLKRRDGSIERLNGAGGLPLGILEDADYDSAVTSLAVGDQLLIVTDGVTEAVHATGDFFGDARVIDWLRGDSAAKLESLVALVRAYEGDAPPSDDVAAVRLSLEAA